MVSLNLIKVAKPFRNEEIETFSSFSKECDQLKSYRNIDNQIENKINSMWVCTCSNLLLAKRAKQ